MHPDEDLNWRVFDMLAALNTPRITNLTWEFPGSEEVTAYTDRPTVADGEMLTLVAATKNNLPGQLVLRGRLNRRPWEQMVDLTKARDEVGFIPRFWAQRHVEGLLKDGEAHREEIVRLSMKHYVTTPFTSLIVLENDQMYQQYKVEKGRKDHWASYPAPEEIPVVHEPVRFRHWRVPEPSTDAPVLKDPNTRQEIIDTLLPTTLPGVDLRFFEPTGDPRRTLGIDWSGVMDGGYDFSLRPGAGRRFSVPAGNWWGNDFFREGTNLHYDFGGVSTGSGVLANQLYLLAGAQNLRAFDYRFAVPGASISRFAEPLDGSTSRFVDPSVGGSWGDVLLGTRSGSAAIQTNFIDGLLHSGRSNSIVLDSPDSMVTSVFNDRGFVVLNAGSRQGVTPNSNLTVQRGGELISRLDIAAIEPRLTVANIAPESLRYGTDVRPGDRVIIVGNVQDFASQIRGLQNTQADFASAAEMRFGREKNGEVADGAAELLLAAEKKRKPLRIGGFITTPDGRVTGRSRSPLFLEEEIVSDGTNLFHIYRELGLVTHRNVTPSVRSAIQQTVPHWPPSLKDLEARWHVTLEEKTDEFFVVALTDPETPRAKLVMKIGHDGRLISVRHLDGEKEIAWQKFNYGGDEVTITTSAGGEQSYEAVEVHVEDALFAAVDIADFATIDMPLRKVASYEHQQDSAAKHSQLRHMIVAALLNPAVPHQNGLQMARAFHQRLLKLDDAGLRPFDKEVLPAFLNGNTIRFPKPGGYFAHRHEVATLSRTAPQRAQVEAFMRNWPGSPSLTAIATRAQAPDPWVPILGSAANRSLAIERIAALGIDKPEQHAIAEQVVTHCIADAKAGQIRYISEQVGKYLRKFDRGGSWKKLRNTYWAEAQQDANLTKLLPAFDLIVQSWDAGLHDECLPLLLKEIEGEDEPALMAEIASIYARHGRLDLACTYYEKALEKIESPSSYLLHEAIEVARRTDDPRRIDWELRALKGLSKQNAITNIQALRERYSDLVQRALDADRVEVAEEVAREGYDRDPAHHDLITALASHHASAGDEANSWLWLSSIIDSHPKDAGSRGAIGDWFQQREKPQRADQMYAEAHGYDSAHPQWLVKRLKVLYGAGEFEKADAVFRQLRETRWAPQLKRMVPNRIDLPLVKRGQLAKFSQETPNSDWNGLEFDAEKWIAQVGQFMADAGHSPLWNKPFYVRQKFEVGRQPRSVLLNAHIRHVECEVYINGVFAHKITDPSPSTNTNYAGWSAALPPAALEAIRPGENVIAYRCRKTGKSPKFSLELLQHFAAPK